MHYAYTQKFENPLLYNIYKIMFIMQWIFKLIKFNYAVNEFIWYASCIFYTNDE